MATFKEANQVRISLKMKLSNHGWYSASQVITCDDGYCVLILVTRLDNGVRKFIPQVIDGISIKVELE